MPPSTTTTTTSSAPPPPTKRKPAPTSPTICNKRKKADLFFDSRRPSERAENKRRRAIAAPQLYNQVPGQEPPGLHRHLVFGSVKKRKLLHGSVTTRRMYSASESDGKGKPLLLFVRVGRGVWRNREKGTRLHGGLEKKEEGKKIETKIEKMRREEEKHEGKSVIRVPDKDEALVFKDAVIRWQQGDGRFWEEMTKDMNMSKMASLDNKICAAQDLSLPPASLARDIRRGVVMAVLFIGAGLGIFKLGCFGLELFLEARSSFLFVWILGVGLRRV